MIVDGRLQAGEPLREARLSELLGISRNSVREGVRILEQSRLVRYEMHRGTVVSTPNIEQLRDLYDARRVVEVSALRNEVSSSDLALLDSAIDRLNAESRDGNAERIVAADLAFHRTIVGFHHNERITDFFTELATEMSYYFTVLSWVDEQYKHAEESIAKEHALIAQAIRSRDNQTAMMILGEHIDHNRARLEDIMREKLYERATPPGESRVD